MLQEEPEVLALIHMDIAEEAGVVEVGGLGAHAVADHHRAGVERRHDGRRGLELKRRHQGGNRVRQPQRALPPGQAFGAEIEGVVGAEGEAETPGQRVDEGRHAEQVGVVADQEQAAAVADEPLDRLDLFRQDRLDRGLDDQHVGILQHRCGDRPLTVPPDVVVPAQEVVEIAVGVGVAPAEPLGVERDIGRLPGPVAVVEHDPPGFRRSGIVPPDPECERDPGNRRRQRARPAALRGVFGRQQRHPTAREHEGGGQEREEQPPGADLQALVRQQRPRQQDDEPAQESNADQPGAEPAEDQPRPPYRQQGDGARGPGEHQRQRKRSQTREARPVVDQQLPRMEKDPAVEGGSVKSA